MGQSVAPYFYFDDNHRCLGVSPWNLPDKSRGDTITKALQLGCFISLVQTGVISVNRLTRYKVYLLYTPSNHLKYLPSILIHGLYYQNLAYIFLGKSEAPFTKRLT